MCNRWPQNCPKIVKQITKQTKIAKKLLGYYNTTYLLVNPCATPIMIQDVFLLNHHFGQIQL